MSSGATVLNASVAPIAASGSPGARPTLLASSRRLGAAARRIPFTMGALTLLLGMGIATGTLWQALDPESGLLETLSFGTQRLQHGQW